MANQVYPLGMQAILESFFLATGPEDGSDLFVVPVNQDYSYSANHFEVDDLGETVLGDPVPLENVTLTGGVIKSDDLVPAWRELTLGDTVKAIILFAGWDGGSQLLAYLDSTVDMNLPIVMTTGQIAVRWSPNGILRI